MPQTSPPLPPTYVYAQGRICTCTMHVRTVHARTVHAHTVHSHTMHMHTVHMLSAHAQCTCTVCTWGGPRRVAVASHVSLLTGHGSTVGLQGFFSELRAALVAQLLLRQLEVDLSLVAVDAILQVERR